MKVYEIQEKFGLDSLAIVERPEPSAGPGQALVKLRAASLNYRDLMTVKGLYNPKQPLPLVPLSDGAGEVVSVGKGVTRVKPGDRVAPIFSQKWIAGEPARTKLSASLGGPLDGVLREFAVFDEDGLVHIPAHLSYEEAATLPCAAVTAWNSLITLGKLKSGDTVLVQGTGGVSIFALQFAVMAGARVIVTSSSDGKIERAIKLGASDGINYKAIPNWDKRARELTAGLGLDYIVEVGGAGTLEKSLRAARVGGYVGLIGVLAGSSKELSILPVLMQNLRIQGVLVGSREMFEEMNRAIAFAQLKPVVDRVFPFEEARQALEWMEAGSHFGKIVIRIP